MPIKYEEFLNELRKYIEDDARLIINAIKKEFTDKRHQITIDCHLIVTIDKELACYVGNDDYCRKNKIQGAITRRVLTAFLDAGWDTMVISNSGKCELYPKINELNTVL